METDTEIKESRLFKIVPFAVFFAALAFSLWCDSVGWRNPIIDSFAFRQTQTAISSFWMLHGAPWLAYETPVLGPHWQIPFEFPLFQWLVALAAKILATPLDQTGRAISIGFWCLTLLSVYLLLGRFHLIRAYRLVFISLMLISPLYLFWSRTFMIESAALFFSSAYLAAVVASLDEDSWYLPLLGCVMGIFAALVKITTFIGFGYAAFALVMTDWWFRSKFKFTAEAVKKHVISFTCFALLPLVGGIIWVRYTDQLKRANPIASAYLQSSSLEGWNFGNLLQRVSSKLWIDAFYRRMVPDILGSSAALWLFIIGLITGLLLLRGRGKRKYFYLSAASFTLFLSVMLTFTNLHLVHSYYQYSNGIFLVGAAGLLIIGLIDQKGVWRLSGVALFAFIGITALNRYFDSYYPIQSKDLNDAPAMQVAAAIRDMTGPNDLIVVEGYDWDSTLPYYSWRRAYMDWPNADYDFFYTERNLKNLRGYKVGGLVACNDAPQKRDFLSQELAQLHFTSMPVFENQLCEIYGPAVGLLPKLPGKYASYKERAGGSCNMESINGESTSNGGIAVNTNSPLTLSGWAIDAVAKQLPEALFVRIRARDGKTFYGRVFQRIYRPDVAKSLGNARYLMSGYGVGLDISKLVSGKYSIALLLASSDGNIAVCGGAGKPISVAKGPLIPESSTVDRADLVDLGSSKSYSFDGIDGNRYSGSLITIQQGTRAISYNGWAIDLNARMPASAVMLLVNGHLASISHYGDVRDDVAQAYKNTAYINSGFHGSLDTSTLKVGKYELSLKIISADGHGYYTGGRWELIID